jgi:hypothetical protein
MRAPAHTEELAVQQDVKYLVLKKRPDSSTHLAGPVIRSACSPEPYPSI